MLRLLFKLLRTAVLFALIATFIRKVVKPRVVDHEDDEQDITH